jgi:hypothetical protein
MDVIIRRLGKSSEATAGVGSNDDIQKAMLSGLKGAGIREGGLFASKNGDTIIKAALACTKSLNSTVMAAANKFLYVALAVADGEERVVAFSKAVGGDESRVARDLCTKVLPKLADTFAEDE